MSFPTRSFDRVAWIDTDQMREVDRVMIDDLGIDLPRMMEGAGRTLAQVAERRFGPSRAVVLVGTGGNGGGGLVAARHLHNHGVDVAIVLARPPEQLTPVPREQFEICVRLGITVVPAPGPADLDADLIVDALIGYGLRGDPRGRSAELIGLVNDLDAPVLALDVPSGLDATSGRTGTPSVVASATMTLAGPKRGLRGSPTVGELYLADISVPPSVYEAFEAGPGPVFDDGPILHLVDGTAH